MFNQIYEIIKKEIQTKNIVEQEQIKYEFEKGIKEFFKSYFPQFKNHLGNMESFIKIIAKNISSNDVEFQNNYQDIENELNYTVSNWKKFLDVEGFVNAIADAMTNTYVKSNNIEAYNIDNAVIDSLNRQVDLGTKLDTEEKTKRVIELLFTEYFDNNNPNAFTSNNEARKYVTSKGKEELLEEMKKTAKIDSSLDATDLEPTIRTAYARNMANNLFKNTLVENDVKKDGIVVDDSEQQLYLSIASDINNASLNDRQKKYLMECLSSGNLQELLSYRVVSEQKVREYKTIINNQKKTY